MHIIPNQFRHIWYNKRQKVHAIYRWRLRRLLYISRVALAGASVQIQTCDYKHLALIGIIR